MPIFRVVPRNYKRPSSSAAPQFLLVKDNWNDFGYQSLYQLVLFGLNAGRVTEDYIGPLKIVKRNQALHEFAVPEEFDVLPNAFISIGQSLDYYSRLNALEPALREAVLEGLQDVVRNPDAMAPFQRDEAFRASFLRDMDPSMFIASAASLLSGRYSSVATERDLAFEFYPQGWGGEPIRFDFGQHLVPARVRKLLPARMSVVIGRNGSGKSTLLARLARVVHGSSANRDRPPLSNLGQITPHGIGFSKVITISFSPFDSFRLPGTTGRERLQLRKELAAGEGRFVYIGVRDLAAELRDDDIPASDLDDALAEVAEDRTTVTRLKSIENLANEFVRAVTVAKKRGRESLLRKVVQIVLSDPSFGDYAEDSKALLAREDLKSEFLKWSTGHKIAMLVIASLAASLEARSLILFDEPETHLHPPLLAAMMHALQFCVQQQTSYCIAATHSPVVLQETLAEHIKVVRREGGRFDVALPSIETFGESIGAITTEVFGLNSEATDFHKILDKIAQTLKSLNDIEALFLGGAMSEQARAYVMSRRTAK